MMPSRVDKGGLPIIFAQLAIDAAVARGVPRERLLAGLEMPTGLFGSYISRIPVNLYLALFQRAAELSGSDGGLGYDIGLRVRLPTLGIFGMAALGQLSFRRAVESAVRFQRMVMPITRLRFFVEDDVAVVDFKVDMAVDPALYRDFCEMRLIAAWRSFSSLVGERWPEVEVWFDHPEPPHHARYRERLPRCRFGMGANQVCFPANLLDVKLADGGDPVTAQQLEEQCRRELAQMGDTEDVVERLRNLLRDGSEGYPDLETACARLLTSSRTLKRHLQQRGTSFQQLLDQARCDEACRLLKTSSLSLDRIAERMGYSDPASFSYAFRKWTGQPPGAWRQQQCS